MSMKSFVKFFFCQFLYKVHYKGLENLNRYEQCLICPNHSHVFDPFFVYPVSTNLSIMAKAELFKIPLLGKLLKHYGVFPVDRNKKDPNSLFHALHLFETKGPRQLLIFPEGGVLKTEDEIGKRIKNGPTFIAAKANLPIIPAFITRRPSLFSRVLITFGEPFYVENDVLVNKEKLRQTSKELVDQIYELRN